MLKRLDRRLLRAMRTRGHSPRAEAVVKGLGTAGEWGAVWIALGLAAAAADGARRGRWASAAAAAPTAVGINFAVKLAVRRQRPRLRRLPPLASAPSRLSFPSAHATSSLAAATAMGRVSPGARVPLYGLAAAICLTRPYLGMHYPSDVLGGVALGLLVGRLWPGVRQPDPEDRLIDLAGAAEGPRPVKIGIVGLPNAGKTTLFNALTQAGAETATYPFTTVDPNVAIVAVPDERLAPVAEAAEASPAVPETIEFHDIAGLVRGASAGEGLGNLFLAAIRETDAICHVVRAHGDEQVPHPSGHPNPAADAEAVETELLLADLEQAERRLETVRKQAGAGGKEDEAERDWLQRVVEALSQGRPVRDVPPPALVPDAPARLQALSSKPVLYVANVDEGADRPPPELVEHARGGASCMAISARIEAELAELPHDDAAQMRAELGLSEPGLERLVRAAYELLELVTFFTAHRGAEARARALPRGSTAWDAAGRVHTDIQSGFVRAEVIGWRELVDAGGYAEARERGLIRTEGRDYPVSDGDVITIRH